MFWNNFSFLSGAVSLKPKLPPTGTTTTRTSWRKCTESDTPTSSTSKGWRRPRSPRRATRPTNTSRTSSCQATTTAQSWTSTPASRPPAEAYSHRRPRTGPTRAPTSTRTLPRRRTPCPTTPATWRRTSGRTRTTHDVSSRTATYRCCRTGYCRTGHSSRRRWKLSSMCRTMSEKQCVPCCWTVQLVGCSIECLGCDLSRWNAPTTILGAIWKAKKNSSVCWSCCTSSWSNVPSNAYLWPQKVSCLIHNVKRCSKTYSNLATHLVGRLFLWMLIFDPRGLIVWSTKPDSPLWKTKKYTGPTAHPVGPMSHRILIFNLRNYNLLKSKEGFQRMLVFLHIQVVKCWSQQLNCVVHKMQDIVWKKDMILVAIVPLNADFESNQLNYLFYYSGRCLTSKKVSTICFAGLVSWSTLLQLDACLWFQKKVYAWSTISSLSYATISKSGQFHQPMNQLRILHYVEYFDLQI